MIKILVISLALVLSFQARAGEDLEALLSDSSPKETHTVQQDALITSIEKAVGHFNGEQNLFVRHIEKGEWSLALIQYAAAFNGTDFEKSASGKALRAYLAYQSNLKISGLEDLFAIENVNDINSEILNVWKKALINDDQAWSLAQIQWKPEWTAAFGPEAEVRFQLSHGQKLTLDQLYDLAKKVSSDSKLRAQIEWQLVLQYSLKDEPVKAAKILNSLMKNSQTQVSQDLMNMTAARLLYQNAYFDAAVKYYEKVPKSSEYWVEAQEEIAWSYLKQGQPQNALAVGETLLHPGLVSLVGPEAFFVKSIGHLKVCDYGATLESLSLYPKNFKGRLEKLSRLEADPNNEQVQIVLNQLQKGKLTQLNVREKLQSLPRRILTDRKLYDLAQAQKVIQSEADTAEKIYVKTLTYTGLQSQFDLLRQRTTLRAQNAKALSFQRVKELAQMEGDEIKKILNKLHIVEAEVIQQVEQAERIAKISNPDAPVKKGSTGSKSKDVLVFPADKEKWFDEISNYRVNVKNGCMAKKESNEKVQ
jgi:hypothetical protein